MLCQSVIWTGFGLPVSVSGTLAEPALTVSDWAERTPTERNIERHAAPLRSHALVSSHSKMQLSLSICEVKQGNVPPDLV